MVIIGVYHLSRVTSEIGRQKLEAGLCLVADGDGFQKHFEGADPNNFFAVKGLVNYYFFKCFAVKPNSDEAVLFAFVMPINSRL